MRDYELLKNRDVDYIYVRDAHKIQSLIIRVKQTHTQTNEVGSVPSSYILLLNLQPIIGSYMTKHVEIFMHMTYADCELKNSDVLDRKHLRT